MSTFEVRARLKVREGKLEGFKRQAAEMMRVTRELDTGTLAYDWFLSADGTECEVREAYRDPDALVDHAFHVREARDVLFTEFAYDHRMAFYGEPSPRLAELVSRIGVNPTLFTLIQALEPVGVS
jgi:quinol monooxygenase YgiN